MKETVKKAISQIWLYVLLIAVMVVVIAAKKAYHIDEIYSYGLANNVGQTSIHPIYAPYTYENPARVYLDYMVVEDGESLSISNCWYNQERDSSPPLYYFSVHVVSAIVALLAGERFSRWTAGSFNMVFILLTFWAFRQILKLFKVKDRELDLFSLFFIFSPGILNIISFFRMYAMAAFFATLITYLIFKYRKQENLKFYICMIFASVGAVLTQYYLIFYLFFISLFYGLSLLWRKEWLKAGKYILTMAISGGLAYLIFPGIINHLFRVGRGVEGIENITSGFEVYGEYLKEYFHIVNIQLFGGLFWLVALVGIACLIYRIICRRNSAEGTEKKIDSDKIWTLCIGILPVILYIMLVAKVAPYRVDRYIMAMYPLIIIYFLLGTKYMLDKLLSDKKLVRQIALCGICVFMLFRIGKDFQWPYLYLSAEESLAELEEIYTGTDGLCVLDVGWKISGNFNEIIMLDTITFFQNDISPLEDMEELKSKDEYILYVVSNDAETIIQQIYEICPQIDSFVELGKSDYSYIYHLYNSNK